MTVDDADKEKSKNAAWFDPCTVLVLVRSTLLCIVINGTCTCNCSYVDKLAGGYLKELNTII